LEASDGINFNGTDRSGVYRWVEETLQRYHYSRLSKEARGMLREFLVKMILPGPWQRAGSGSEGGTLFASAGHSTPASMVRRGGSGILVWWEKRSAKPRTD